MARLMIIKRRPTSEEVVKEMRFKRKDDAHFSYCFELDENGTPILKTRIAMENFNQCVINVNVGTMTAEIVERPHKHNAKTIAICPECGNHIEKNNDGITICPHCCSMYARNNEEIYF